MRGTGEEEEEEEEVEEEEGGGGVREEKKGKWSRKKREKLQIPQVQARGLSPSAHPLSPDFDHHPRKDWGWGWAVT